MSGQLETFYVQGRLEWMSSQIELEGGLETLLVVLDHVPNSNYLLLSVGDGLGSSRVECPAGSLMDLLELSIAGRVRSGANRRTFGISSRGVYWLLMVAEGHV